jgi:hypothetical protein
VGEVIAPDGKGDNDTALHALRAHQDFKNLLADLNQHAWFGSSCWSSGFSRLTLGLQELLPNQAQSRNGGKLEKV